MLHSVSLCDGCRAPQLETQIRVLTAAGLCFNLILIGSRLGWTGSRLTGVASLADYLDLSGGQAREQFWLLLQRGPAQGSRQVVFLPTETLLCFGASFLVNHRHFGGRTAHQAPEPVPTLARLFSRPPSSVLAKMANLDGSRPNGGKWDALVGSALRSDLDRYTHIYAMMLKAARTEGIGPTRLPDFLALESGLRERGSAR